MTSNEKEIKSSGISMKYAPDKHLPNSSLQRMKIVIGTKETIVREDWKSFARKLKRWVSQITSISI